MKKAGKEGRGTEKRTTFNFSQVVRDLVLELLGGEGSRLLKPSPWNSKRTQSSWFLKLSVYQDHKGQYQYRLLDHNSRVPDLIGTALGQRISISSIFSIDAIDAEEKYPENHCFRLAYCNEILYSSLLMSHLGSKMLKDGRHLDKNLGFLILKSVIFF